MVSFVPEELIVLLKEKSCGKVEMSSVASWVEDVDGSDQSAPSKASQSHIGISLPALGVLSCP